MTLYVLKKTPTIPRPPFSKLGRKLESLCRKALYDFKLLDQVDHLGIALSGGKDSLTLLFLLKAILGRGEKEIPITAFHLTGAFSCGPGVYGGTLEEICQELNVSFIPIQATPSQETPTCYSCSRSRRSAIFKAAKSRGIHTIAFGHHRDDSIQTLLLNLLHKGEFAANLPKIPLHEYGITLIRPLIYFREQEIKEFARQYGFARIVCQCPIGEHSMRRKTEDLIQQIEQLFPHARENLSHASFKYGSQKALRIP